MPTYKHCGKKYEEHPAHEYAPNTVCPGTTLEESTKGAGATIAYLAGVISGAHKHLHTIRDEYGLTEDQIREVDSAQVLMEAAFEKLEKVLHSLSTSVFECRVCDYTSDEPGDTHTHPKET